jgi:mRNA interferase RelE/StbE
MYTIRIERKAQKKLAKISNPYYSKIKTAILDLGNNPRPQGFKKLKGRNGYRIRVADYRVIYEIIDQELIIDVIEVDSRGNIYKK